MAKKGKITIHVSDYNNVSAYAKLIGVELFEQSQIGQEIITGIKYKDLTHVYKLGQCSKIPLVQVHPGNQANPTPSPVGAGKPSTVATASKATKKK